MNALPRVAWLVVVPILFAVSTRTGVLAADLPVPAIAELAKAREVHAQAMADLHDAVARMIEERDARERNKSNPDLGTLAALKAERAALDARGEVPQWAASGTIKERFSAAQNRLIAAIKTARLAYIRNKQDDLAQALQDELNRLAAARLGVAAAPPGRARNATVPVAQPPADKSDKPAAAVDMPKPDAFPRIIDLLSLIDPGKDSINGDWNVQDGNLVAHRGTMVRLQVPYRPPAEYDLKITYKFTGGNEGMMAMLPTAKGQVMTVMNPNTFYFEGHGGSFAKVTHPPLVKQEPVTVIFSIRKDRVRASVGGHVLSEFNPADRSLGIQGGWRLHDDGCLGLGNWNTTIIFLGVELTEVSGPGTRLR